MANRKTGKLSRVEESDEFAKLITHRIFNAQVKTATPSRAQNKIQVRITWTDPDGTPGLGYMSMHSTAAEKGSTGPTMENFVDDVFRIVQWAQGVSRDTYGHDGSFSEFHKAVWSELRNTAVLHATSPVHALKQQAVDTIIKCAAGGAHKKARRARNQAKAKLYIEQSVTFAINNGFKDDEIQELIKLAFVKHTMES